MTSAANVASPMPTPTNREPNTPGSPARSSCSTLSILARPDLDDALGDSRLVGSRGLGRGTAHHPAIGEIERAAVQRALHRSERSAEPHHPLVQRRTLMRAAIADREQFLAVAHEEDVRAVRVDPHRLAIRQIGQGPNRDPAAVLDLGVDVVTQLARLLPPDGALWPPRASGGP